MPGPLATRGRQARHSLSLTEDSTAGDRVLALVKLDVEGPARVAEGDDESGMADGGLSGAASRGSVPVQAPCRKRRARSMGRAGRENPGSKPRERPPEWGRGRTLGPSQAHLGRGLIFGWHSVSGKKSGD